MNTQKTVLEQIKENYGQVADTDSYKLSHAKQYPKGATGMFSYIESRGGEFDETVFFGLQYILKEYFTKPITAKQVMNMAEFATQHGEPFNLEGWMRIVTKYNGVLPVKIRAVPEGTVVPVKNVLCTIESTTKDEETFWAVSYIETKILRLWYPTTVATLSREMKKIILASLDKTSMFPQEQIPFKLHDFGSRGVSSMESAAIGGAAHLVNFMGSDTIVGVMCANIAYNIPMSAFSIPAAEHTTMTMRGKEGETEAFRTMIQLYGGEGKIFAVVSDGYDYWNALKVWGTELKQEVIDSKATVVIRPDSGYPPSVVRKSLEILDQYYGSVKNSKGYKVLNNVRIMQGDGITLSMTKDIIYEIEDAGFSMDNVAFGMGGGLLQMVNRDTQKFAMKCSAAYIDGECIPVFKDPVTDPGKVSKKGRMTLVQNTESGTYSTVRLPLNSLAHPYLKEVLQDVWVDGELLVDDNLTDIRQRAVI